MSLPEHVERLLGVAVVGWRPVTGGGWSASVRGIAELADGPGTIEVVTSAEWLGGALLVDRNPAIVGVLGLPAP